IAFEVGAVVALASSRRTLPTRHTSLRNQGQPARRDGRCRRACGPAERETTLMFDGTSILITGGTGSFGKAFIKTVLSRHPEVRRVICLSRDELKQFEMSRMPEFQDKRLRFFLGDIR